KKSKNFLLCHFFQQIFLSVLLSTHLIGMLSTVVLFSFLIMLLGLIYLKKEVFFKWFGLQKQVRHCTLLAVESPPHTCMGISLQINKSKANTCRDIGNGNINESLRNISKNK
ncbi:uncharacterized protein VP01_3652g5, partial [Puccinia sorghi]